MARVRAGQVKVLFVSPEKILSPSFHALMAALPAPGISFVCVDEAHCVSEWSHNFRPAYMRLHSVLFEVLHVTCVLALTATATRTCAESVCASLGIDPDDGVIRCCVTRSNLQLSVSEDAERELTLVALLRSARYVGLKSIIVYVARQKQADQVAVMLQSQLLDAASYHAGKPPAERAEVQARFMSGKLRIVVATIAFGMGLDKRDVRAVIHLFMPASLEEYVQEVGRAGRDGLPAYGHLFVANDDLTRSRAFIHADEVDRDTVLTVLGWLFPTCSTRGVSAAKRRRMSALSAYYVTLSMDRDGKKLDIKNEVLETVLCLVAQVAEEYVQHLPSCHGARVWAHTIIN
jgi:ATP-dependent DNA helicase Q4